jgi:Flp pilus assembly secretin CpaC
MGEDEEMTRRLEQVTGIRTISVMRTASNAIAVYGTVRNRAEYDTVYRYALLLPQVAGGTAVPTAGLDTNLATAPSPHVAPVTGDTPAAVPAAGYRFPVQVQMFVRILDPAGATLRTVTAETTVVEISRTALRNLGIQVGSASVLSDGDFTEGEFLGGENAAGEFRNLNPFRVRLNALYRKGNARILSQPNLIAQEGTVGQITVGGQRPIPVINNSGAAGGTQTASVEFRRFGVILTMRPTVTDDDTIILQIRADVTDIDFTTAINLNGAVIPGERVRSVDTILPIREGDTIVMGGLITNDRREQTSKVPFLSKIPILGKLFQSRRFENNESELAIFLTPRISRLAVSPNTTVAAMRASAFPELPGNQQSQNVSNLGGASGGAGQGMPASP